MAETATVTARFKVSKITPAYGEDPDQPHRGEVEMTPDYAGGKNAEWSEATPNGVFRLGITNADAFKRFELGAEVAITMEVTPA